MLTYCGLMTSYGDMDLSQYRLRLFVAWRRQEIPRNNVDLSSQVFWGIHFRAISKEVSMNLNCNMKLLKLLPHTAPSPSGRWFSIATVPILIHQFLIIFMGSICINTASVPVLIHRVNPNVPGTRVWAVTGTVRPSTGTDNPRPTLDAQRSWKMA